MTNSIVEENQVTLDMLVAGAEKVGKLAAQEVIEAEENATFSKKVIEAIKEAQISEILKPKSYGGPQVDLRGFAKIIRTVSKHSVSAGWLTYLYPLHNTLPSYLPVKGRDEIFNQGGLICDVFAPVGKTEKDGDGYRITGTYNYASGVLYSDWVGLGVFMELPESTRPEFCMLFLPISDVQVVGNWNTLGLRPTGSNQVIADNVYVPRERILRLEVADTTRRPPEEDYDKEYPYYHVPYFSAFYLGFPNVALGGAERLIAEFKERTERRIRLDGTPEKESPRSQRVLAELMTQYHAADALMDKYINLLENFERDGAVGRGEFNAIRAKIVQICADIAVKVLLTLGGAALAKGDTVEIFTRDILAVATHITSLYEDSVTAYGKNLFGYEAIGTWG